uniref:Uncharacterized protein n=1 Tax=Pipistrellus kuhlii TaxID=59472 RepID=A0A7J7YYL6_PIPKU|nr:hypothetical protein mPipKuh1_009940 [Pipistrellus kuhlii]
MRKSSASPAVSTEAASCPFFLAIANLPLDARSEVRRSRHSMSKQQLALLAEAPGGRQRPVLSRVGAEGALFGVAVDLQLESLLVGLFVLIGRHVHTLLRGHVPSSRWRPAARPPSSWLVALPALSVPLVLRAPGSGPRSGGRPPSRSGTQACSPW